MLLFDENLSFRLVKQLASDFGDVQHVSEVGLLRATDAEIWDFAKAHGLAIVSKDRDFVDLAVLRGRPPPVIVLDFGNAETQTVARAMNSQMNTIKDFLDRGEESVLAIRLN